MKNKDDFKELLETIRLFASELSNNESFVSHIFVSLIYLSAGIKSYELIPQGKSKRGLIDFLYLPKKLKDISYTVELKGYKSLNKDSVSAKTQMNKYLKSGIRVLKKLKRNDIWRVGIICDLNTIVVCLRRTEWKNKTKIYYDEPKVFNEDLKRFSITFKNIVNENIGKLANNIFWKKRYNRFDIVIKELKNNKMFYNKIFVLWKKQVCKTEKRDISRSKGLNIKFKSSYKYALETRKTDKAHYSGEVIKVFSEPKIMKEIKYIFEKDYGVNFNHLQKCNIFNK